MFFFALDFVKSAQNGIFDNFSQNCQNMIFHVIKSSVNQFNGPAKSPAKKNYF